MNLVHPLSTGSAFKLARRRAWWYALAIFFTRSCAIKLSTIWLSLKL
jgi:hypothetical protein